MFKRIGHILVAAIIGAFCLGLGEWVSSPGGYGLVSTAEARGGGGRGAGVGRPLTPVSVAGVARRQVRRCAAGVNCPPEDY
jgi:hypothetical protein